jgi:hypothetical protein
MKKALIFFATFFLFLFATAQSNNKVSELGIVFSDADQFGLTYRVGNEHALWRFNALSLGGSISTSTETNSVNSNTTLNSANGFSFGISVGREYRIPINNLVDFRYGADLAYSYSSNYSEVNYSNNNSSNYQKNVGNTPSINLVFGLNFKLKNFKIGAELNPSVQYNFSSSDITEGTTAPEQKDQTRLTFSLSNLPVKFSVVYPF